MVRKLYKSERLIRNRTIRLVRFVGVAIFARAGMTLWATDGGSLLGTITDPGASAIPGAKVTVTETATAATQTVVSDRQGFYSFQSLPFGRYDVEFSAPGFRLLRRTGVVIDVDSKVVVDTPDRRSHPARSSDKRP